MPRSAIMITKSRRLSLKLVYQATHKMVICPSKCRPLNRSSIGTNRCISSSSPATLAFAPEPGEGTWSEHAWLFAPTHIHGSVGEDSQGAFCESSEAALLHTNQLSASL